MWIGTEYGLNKYDGHQIYSYNSYLDSAKNQLSNGHIFAISEDKFYNLWIGTFDGLNKLDLRTGEFHSYFPNDQLSNLIYDLFPASDGDIWVGTADGLFTFNPEGEHFTKVHLMETPPEKFSVFSIAEHKGVIYTATSHGLFAIDADKQVENWSARSLTSSDRVMSVFVQGNNLWVGHFTTGVGVIDLETEQAIFYENDERDELSLADNYIYKIAEDKDGVIWLATDHGLSKHLGKGVFQNFYEDPSDEFSITSNFIHSVYFDDDNRIWVATRSGGVCYYNPQVSQFNHIKSNQFRAEELTSNNVAGFVDLPNDQLAIATDGGGVNIYDQSTGKFVDVLDAEDGLSGNKALAMVYDPRGGLWVGTWAAGLNYYDFETGQVRLYQYQADDKNSIAGNNIFDLYQSRDGNLWVGHCLDGLSRLDPVTGKVKVYAEVEDSDYSLKGTEINEIAEDHTGNIYLATDFRGLEVIDGTTGKVMQYEADGSPGALSFNSLSSVLVDQLDQVWVGTKGGGLNKLDRKTGLFENYTVNEGLPSNLIQGMALDKNGFIWISTTHGVSQMNPKTMEFINYGQTDGLQGDQFLTRSAYSTKNGLIAFGGNNGFNLFDPNLLKKDTSLLPIYISGLQVYNEPIEKIQAGEVVTFRDRVSLSSDQNFLTISFGMIDYNAAQKHEYLCKMEGLHDQWISVGNGRSVTFSGLNPGNYTFQIKARNEHRELSNSTASLKIDIALPWWKSYPALIAYFIAVILILFIFRALIVTRTNFINDIRNGEMERESLEKLNQAKLNFFTNISHEIRTPLTLITGPIEQLIQRNSGDLVTKRQLHAVKNNTDRLLRLVNQLLEFRKVESNALQLKVSESDFVQFIREIMLSFSTYAEQKSINFQLKTDQEEILLHYDSNQCEKIVFNLLSNAFKYTPEGGRITVEVLEGEESVVLVVDDNGPGIDQVAIEKIFNWFYSSNDSDLSGMNTGIGLAFTNSLVKLHHGTIQVSSEKNVSTRFEVKFRKGKDHFSKDQFDETSPNDKLVGYSVSGSESTEEVARNEKPEVGGQQKLMIVEDNVEVRAFIKSLFVDSYLIEEATNGREALEKVDEFGPDLVISDVMMPEMDGIHLCKALKSDLQTSHIPVILLTARTSLIFKMEGYENGADDYVSKPFNGELLQTRVRNLLKQREALRKKFGDQKRLVIEPSEVSVTSADEQFVQNLMESIEKNMGDVNFRVEDLGKDIGFSRTQLYRKIKALTGQSPNELIRSMRLKRAAQLLKSDAYTISEITYMVGFEDLQYFRSIFRKQFGESPSVYKKEHLQ